MNVEKLVLSIVKTILQWGAIILFGMLIILIVMLIILIVSTAYQFLVAIGLVKWTIYIIIICIFIKHIQYNYRQ